MSYKTVYPGTPFDERYELTTPEGRFLLAKGHPGISLQLVLPGAEQAVPIAEGFPDANEASVFASAFHRGVRHSAPLVIDGKIACAAEVPMNLDQLRTAYLDKVARLDPKAQHDELDYLLAHYPSPTAVASIVTSIVRAMDLAKTAAKATADKPEDTRSLLGRFNKVDRAIGAAKRDARQRAKKQ